jgi:adenosylmethionine-8-amino-7-oxononanoate aminotransferase
MHGPTYMGNALACAAAQASLDLFESEPRLQQVAAIERQLGEGLAPLRGRPGITGIAVKGAIGAVTLDHEPDLTALRAAFVERGIWLKPFGRTVYTTPPLVIGQEDLARVIAAIQDVLTNARAPRAG